MMRVGEAARFLGVSARTVCKWFDSGQLKGYRLPGKRLERRILRVSAVAFAKENGIPLPEDLANAERAA
jgi:excisionase family DNA binding protein